MGGTSTRTAVRQQRFRTRQAAGKIVLRVVVNHVDLVEALIEDGRLARRDEDDRAAIAAAVERLLGVLSSLRVE